MNYLFKDGMTGEVASVPGEDSDQALNCLIRDRKWDIRRIIYEGKDNGQGFDPRFSQGSAEIGH